MVVDIPEFWTPTPESINDLPDPLRRYIRGLETPADCVDLMREGIRLRQENAALRAECEQLAAKVIGAD